MLLTYPSHNIVLIIGAHRPSNITPVCSIDSDRVKRSGEKKKHAFAIFPFVIQIAFLRSVLNDGEFCEAIVFCNLSIGLLLCNKVCGAVRALTGRQTSTHANSVHI